MRRSTKTIGALAATLALGLAATACAPPGGSTTDEPAASTSASPVSKDISGVGDVTLTVWDQNTDTGINDAQEELNKQFQQKYPNVKIERVSRSFSDLKTTLKLALTSKNPPDVVQANQGYPDMGSFVSGGLLRPEDDYAKLYGWDTYYPEQQLNINKFSADGKDWQSGNLYGVSQTGEIVGVYYNRKILKDLNLEVPQTITEFEAMLPTIKDSGMLPIAYGDVEKSPGIHIYGITQGAIAGEQAVTELVTGRSGAWTDEPSVKAAQTIQDWATKGYITEGANGISRDVALAEFGKGKAAFVITGTWEQPKVIKSLGAGRRVRRPRTGRVGHSGDHRRGGVGLGDHHRQQESRRRRGVHRLHHQRQRQPGVDRQRQPAGRAARGLEAQGGHPAGRRGQLSGRSQHRCGPGALSGLRHPDLLRHVVRGGPAIDGRETDPQEFAEQLQKDYDAFLKTK